MVEEDLIHALRSGKIEGTALDVTVQEPLQEDSVWFSEDLKERVLLTFHTQDRFGKFKMKLPWSSARISGDI